MNMDCKTIQRKVSRYLDNELSTKEKVAIEAHINECALCAAEKKDLENLTGIFRKIPDITPRQHSEELFWEKVHQAKRHGFIEKVRSFITQWGFIPVYYPATALLLLGLVTGVIFSKVYTLSSPQNRLHPSAIEYLALNRMDSMPYNSIAGVYLSGAHIKQDITGSEK